MSSNSLGFQLRDGILHAGSTSLADIAAAVGTPVYIYSAEAIAAQYATLRSAFPDARICYAVKANSNLSVLRIIKGLGTGFDIVSGGELQRVAAVGGAPESILFSGVGKSAAELSLALKLGIGCFNVESEGELERLARLAERLQRTAPVAARINPEVDAGAHPYIATGLKESKFGVPAAIAPQLCAFAADHPWLEIKGIACHIGSQIASPAPYLEALGGLLNLADELLAQGIALEHLDIGGGFGIAYRDEAPLDLAALGQAVGERMRGRRERLVIEPGRYLVASACLLLTRVEYLKKSRAPGHRNFAVVDAAMNDLLRPSLYGAWHAVQRVQPPSAEATTAVWDLVGPICETGDFLAQGRQLAIAPGDLLAIDSAGAYGMALSSNYNSRGRAAEVLVQGGRFRTIRRRERIGDLLALEWAGLED